MYGASSKVFNKYEVIFAYSDLSVREFFILLCLVVIVLFGGFYPNFILDPITLSTGHYIHFSNILYEGF
jgi:NADH:ubiquinone oxidoreductase subunit 4 (subunit M)